MVHQLRGHIKSRLDLQHQRIDSELKTIGRLLLDIVSLPPRIPLLLLLVLLLEEVVVHGKDGSLRVVLLQLSGQLLQLETWIFVQEKKIKARELGMMVMMDKDKATWKATPPWSKWPPWASEPSSNHQRAWAAAQCPPSLRSSHVGTTEENNSTVKLKKIETNL